MGNYCEAVGFYRKDLGKGGSIVRPETITSDEVYCEDCHVNTIKTIIDKKSSTESNTGRGKIEIFWDEVKVECPKCKKTGVVEENYSEEDVSYYPNDERRTYKIKMN